MPETGTGKGILPQKEGSEKKKNELSVIRARVIRIPSEASASGKRDRMAGGGAQEKHPSISMK